MMKIVGHRGARGLAPENTAKSIRKAISHGVDEIEIDVRCTKDGVAILHHDADLKDSFTARYPVKHHTYAELLERRPDLLTLDQAIRIVAQQVPLQIEVKDTASIRPVIDSIQNFLSAGWHEHDLLVGSKRYPVLKAIKHTLPSTPLVVIDSFLSIRAVSRANALGTRRISMRNWWMWDPFIRSMHHRGYELYAYTVNSADQARAWSKSGLAGIITDYPDIFAVKQSPKKTKGSV